MPRKHLIASGINKKQQQQAKSWMKSAKEIKAAAKMGGPNPEANPRLKVAIERALNNNLSRDSIERNINGASKDADNLKELTYEGYGPNGLAIIVRALT
ncbi:YebC/PmpR family DNA-binding transcriptional regulator, partial [Ureaplasma parvum]